jgi:hypothetical protein
VAVLEKYVPTYVAQATVDVLDALVVVDRGVSEGVSRADEMRAAVELGLPALQALTSVERVELFGRIRSGLPSS